MSTVNQQILPAKAPSMSLEMQLIAILRESSVSELMKTDNEELKLLLAEISTGLNMARAIAAPKIFQLKQSLGEKDLLKLVCFILKVFSDSTKVKNGLSNLEIIETANLIIEKYTHESIKDIILAFKQAKLSGRKFYNILTITMISEIFNSHFLTKSQYIEARHQQFKEAESNNEIQWLKAMPISMQQKYLCAIPKNHINREILRLKATIQKYYK